MTQKKERAPSGTGIPSGAEEVHCQYYNIPGSIIARPLPTPPAIREETHMSCTLCRQTPHHSGCPYADNEPPAVLQCGYDGCNIYADEDVGTDSDSGSGYYDIDGMIVCRHCARDMGDEKLMELAGYPLLHGKRRW